MNLARLTYANLAKRLASESSESLVALLNDRSTRVGDTACDWLSKRNERALVLDAAMSGKLTTRNGKVRALNYFSQRGRSMPEAIPAYLKYICDPHPDVVDCALFGLVLWNDPQHIPAIRAIDNPRANDLRDEAITALERREPKLFTKYFHDAAGVWAQSTAGTGGG